eukprot:809444-Pelagomonas_calceolata.AAC.2
MESYGATSSALLCPCVRLQAEAFVKERIGKTVTVNECTGPVTTFIVEPFMPHKEEMYMCIQYIRLLHPAPTRFLTMNDKAGLPQQLMLCQAALACAVICI